MLSNTSREVACAAKPIYAQRLRGMLEEQHCGEYVCIEPESGDFFLGSTLDAAVNHALDAYPERLTHTIRVGHTAALHLGATSL